jgi:hypothetical protein
MPAGLVKEVNAALADPKDQGAIFADFGGVPAMTPTDFDLRADTNRNAVRPFRT